MKSIPFFLVLMAYFIVNVAHAKTIAATQNDVQYTIAEDNTLAKLQRKYLVAGALSQLIKHNQIADPDYILPGQILNIPRSLLRTEKTAASIFQLYCHTHLFKHNTQEQLKIGSEIVEGDIIAMPNDCRVGIAFKDQSKLFLPSGTTIKIEFLRKNVLENHPEVRINLINGSIDIDVDETRHRKAPFEIITPRAVMGVRGTQFSVANSNDLILLEVFEGLVEAKQPNQVTIVKPGEGIAIAETEEPIIKKTIPDIPKILQITQASADSTSYIVKIEEQEDSRALVVSQDSFYNFYTHSNNTDYPGNQFITPALTKQAYFFTIAAKNSDYLKGPGRTIALCKSASCDLGFNLSKTESAARIFRLNRVDDNNNVIAPWSFEIKLKPDAALFFVRNLPKGDYHWSLTPINSATKIGPKQGKFSIIPL